MTSGSAKQEEPGGPCLGRGGVDAAFFRPSPQTPRHRFRRALNIAGGFGGNGFIPPNLAFLPLAFLLCAAATPATPQITQAWARATLPNQDTGVVYLTLQSPTADALTGADTPDAGMAMLHQSTSHNGMADMQDVDSVPLPAGKPVPLAPNGTHIMLMDLKHALKPGATLHLTLHFAHAPSQEIAVPVRPIGATGP